MCSLHRRNAKRDANEKEIVSALRKVGAKVALISGAGFPDLVCWYRGRITLIECKTAKGRATSAQEATTADGWPVVTVKTVEESLRAIGAIQ
jgi:Holliday junction resolvase